MFSIDSTVALNLNLVLKNFLSEEFLYFKNKFVSFYSLNHGFDFLGWRFSVSKPNILLAQMSQENIKSYTLRFKLIVKNVGKGNFCTMLNLINKEITILEHKYGMSSNFCQVRSKIDIYLYKLLWHLVKKRHPRRPNTWIYSKYWKKVLGSWRFFIFDSLLGSTSYLILNSCNKYNLYNLPSSFNFFHKNNIKKLNNISFKKAFLSNNYICSLIWKKQLGLCSICSRPFECFSFLQLSLCFLKNSKVKNVENELFNYVLVHTYCLS